MSSPVWLPWQACQSLWAALSVYSDNLVSHYEQPFLSTLTSLSVITSSSFCLLWQAYHYEQLFLSTLTSLSVIMSTSLCLLWQACQSLWAALSVYSDNLVSHYEQPFLSSLTSLSVIMSCLSTLTSLSVSHEQPFLSTLTILSVLMRRLFCLLWQACQLFIMSSPFCLLWEACQSLWVALSVFSDKLVI